jgi:hypothetical protein
MDHRKMVAMMMMMMMTMKIGEMILHLLLLNLIFKSKE